jgi:hypothetical protein
MSIAANKKWWLLYVGLGAASLAAYFTTKGFLIMTIISNVVISNLTLNLLLFVMTWGALGPYIFRKKSFTVKWGLTLVGFILIIILLTFTGTHTRLTDILGVFKK